jgi:hypothetical protein
MQKGTLLHLLDSIPSNNPIAFGVAQQAWKHPETAARIDHEQAGSGSGNTTNAHGELRKDCSPVPSPNGRAKAWLKAVMGRGLTTSGELEVETSRIQTSRRLAAVRIQTKS